MMNAIVIYGSTAGTGLLAGGFHGFCDNKGIDLKSENLEAILKYGPTVFSGLLFGGLSATIIYALCGKKIDAVGMGVVCGARGAAIGGLGTLVGYCAGYTLGGVLK